MQKRTWHTHGYDVARVIVQMGGIGEELEHVGCGMVNVVENMDVHAYDAIFRRNRATNTCMLAVGSAL